MSDVTNHDRLSQLPRELIAAILSHLTTPDLLPLALISRHVHRHVLKTYHARLAKAAALADHHLILECYDPCAQSIPHHHCSACSTPGLAHAAGYSTGSETSRLSILRKDVFTHFTLLPDQDPETPGTDTDINASPSRRTNTGLRLAYDHDVEPFDPEDVNPASSPLPSSDYPATSRVVHIDANELFTQLCCVVHLVATTTGTTGQTTTTATTLPRPPPPPPPSLRSVVEVCEGTLRVWRDRLGTLLLRRERERQDRRSSGFGTGDARHDEVIADDDGDYKNTEHDDVLWVNNSSGGVGVRIRILEDVSPRPGPVGTGETALDSGRDDVAVVYRIELRELRIRTSFLLEKLEVSQRQQLEQLGRGRAIIFRSYGL